VPTFENGWICTNCWKANREQDVRCYRCHQLSPDYRIVPVEPGGREPRRPRGSVLKPAIARMSSALGRTRAAAWRPMGAGLRYARGTVRLAGSLLAAAARGGKRAIDSAARGALRQTAAGIAGVAALGASIWRGIVGVASAIGAAARGALHLMASGARSGARATFAALAAIGRMPLNGAARLGSLLTVARQRLAHTLQVARASGRRLLSNRHG
jgi:hypothetical protein